MKKIIFLLTLCITATGFAQEATSTNDDEENNGWELDVMPYVWMANVSGDISFLNQTVPADVEFSDILSNLKMGFLLHAEASKDRWFIVGDILFLRVEKRGRLERLGLNTELTMKQIIGEMSAGYTLLESKDWFYIDGFAGFRYFSIDNVMDIGNLEVLDRVINTTDPIVGVRFRTDCNNWISSLRADVGGFGIGSELSWKANLLVGYRFSDLFSLLGGFQMYGLDYEKDNFGMDIKTAGFGLGFNFNFQ